MRYELDEYNNEECLREHIEWCQRKLELDGSMAKVVYVDEVGFDLHLTCQFRRVHQGQIC
jgi:hypothetical protein